MNKFSNITVVLLTTTTIIGCSSEPRAPGKAEAWVMAQTFVEKNLKAPSTADYGWQRYDEAVTELGGDRFKVSGWVDSQNSFGATIRTQFTCEVQCLGDDRWRLNSIEFNE